MKTKLFTALFTATVLAACSTTTTSVTNMSANDPMTSCSLETVTTDTGPIRQTLFVVGTFHDGEWMHLPARGMKYKGDGIYQVITTEKSGTKNLQVSTMNWKPQFTAAGRMLNVGEIKELKRGGFMKDTSVKFDQDGQYVWSVKVNDDASPSAISVAKCTS